MIEDNPTDVFLIKEALRVHSINAQLQILEDGEEAINLIERLDSSSSDISCPDLILLDINLPRTDGFTVLEHLHQSRQCSSIPVVIMSSSEASVDRMKATNLHAREYFQKPAGFEAFLKIGLIIENILKTR